MFFPDFIGARRRPARIAATCALLALTTVAACGDDDDDENDLTGPGQGVARGASIFGVDAQNTLVAFGRGNPTSGAVRTTAITGLASGETVVGIDFRADAAATAERGLYAVTSASRIYVIDTTSGAATAIGSAAFTPAVSGAAFGVDFNPTVDRVRLHSDTEQNLRLNQLTGAVAATDTPLAYATGDASAGQNPMIVGTAYTNSVPGATTTELFAIDSDRDQLVFLATPNAGGLTTRGPLGVNTTTAVGFDIVGAGSGTAYATLTPSGTSRSRLYTINLTTGAATEIGDVNFGRPLVGIAVVP